ncbi:MAG: sigma-54 interaction domain-containing protein [Bryobacteraceae bacterium]
MSTHGRDVRNHSQAGATLWLRAPDPECATLRRLTVELLQAAGWTVTPAPNRRDVLTVLCVADARRLPEDHAYASSGPPLLCCGPLLPQWPVEARCRLLRAGTKRFLDSSDHAFPSRLVESAAELGREYQSQQRQGEELRSSMQSLGLVGRSPSFLALLRTVVRVAPLSDLPVLITGETGTGKELFARAIHQRDPARAMRAMVTVNCAALSPGLLESELFGFRRGSFTGADRDRLGLLRSADGGVLFLDEAAELPLELQAKFLRALQSGEFLPIGDDHARHVNVRVVAATNQPLESLVAQGKFREDLYHRLNVVRLCIPPLRERKEDIAPLASYFCARYRPGYLDESGSSPDLVEALEQARFPGNVRQLENIIRWALANKTGQTPLELADCPPELWEELEHSARLAKPPAPADSLHWAEAVLARHQGNLAEAVEECERTMIAIVLGQRQGNQSETARHLGITPRSVYNKLRKYGLTA